MNTECESLGSGEDEFAANLHDPPLLTIFILQLSGEFASLHPPRGEECKYVNQPAILHTKRSSLQPFQEYTPLNCR